MHFIMFMSFVTTTFSQIGLRGSDTSFTADSIRFIDDEEYHWKQFNRFQQPLERAPFGPGAVAEQLPF